MPRSLSTPSHSPSPNPSAILPFRWVDDPHCWLLTILRVFTLLSLLLSLIATIALTGFAAQGSGMEKIDTAVYIFTTILLLFLMLTELDPPIRVLRRWVKDNWPVLGKEAGLVGLGIVMGVVGVVVLAAADGGRGVWRRGAEGRAVWRGLVMGAGIVGILLGGMNIAASFFFRRTITPPTTATRIILTARQVRSRAYHARYAVSLPLADPGAPYGSQIYLTSASASQLYRSPSDASSAKSSLSSSASSVFEARTLERNVSTRSSGSRYPRGYGYDGDHYSKNHRQLFPAFSSSAPSRSASSSKSSPIGGHRGSVDLGTAYELRSEDLFSASVVNGYGDKGRYLSPYGYTSPGRQREHSIDKEEGSQWEDVVTLSDVKKFKLRDAVSRVPTEIGRMRPQEARVVGDAPSSVYSRSVSGWKWGRG
ncbi:hypothetical protein EX30DRAFT_396368 [Ascodesmis nigricans]|uniref:DUF7598 domain-containing protein n=1 Tax=Ascodesmis nigricans TaxID=341454 RepID=A0A4S2MUW6_9PEZI|nr:hypothetical protein EX30DRAFT_396368 [Ascodesmis nigricans]